MERSESIESVHREQQLQETILSNTQITELPLEENESYDTRTSIAAAEAIILLDQAKMLNHKTSSQIRSIVSETSHLLGNI